MIKPRIGDDPSAIPLAQARSLHDRPSTTGILLAAGAALLLTVSACSKSTGKDVVYSGTGTVSSGTASSSTPVSSSAAVSSSVATTSESSESSADGAIHPGIQRRRFVGHRVVRVPSVLGVRVIGSL